MVSIHELFEAVDRLPDADKWQLVKHVLDTLQQGQNSATTATDYHQFLQETYGVLRDTPIERWDQGDYENREPLVTRSTVGQGDLPAHAPDA